MKSRHCQLSMVLFSNKSFSKAKYRNLIGHKHKMCVETRESKIQLLTTDFSCPGSLQKWCDKFGSVAAGKKSVANFLSKRNENIKCCECCTCLGGINGKDKSRNASSTLNSYGNKKKRDNWNKFDRVTDIMKCILDWPLPSEAFQAQWNKLLK